MSTAGGQCVLIVEDSWLLAAEVRRWLEEEGVSVAGPAANEQEALEIADSAKPQFALVDYNLGGSLATSLIDSLIERDVCVLVLTGYSDLGKAGERVKAVLHKPCDKQRVIAALRAAGLGRRQT